MASVTKSNYITPEGEVILRQELRHLWRVVRPEWTQRVSDAAKEGDRSENAEYIYSKKKLREIDRRVRYLSKRLEEVQVVQRIPDTRDKVYFGAWVTLETVSGILNYRLVGSDEFDQHNDYISIDSPVARQLVGKQVGDEIKVSIDGRQVTYLIIKVYYKESSE